MKTALKRLAAAFMVLCLLVPSLAFAKKKANEPIPERYASVLQTFNASDAESLYQSILDYLNRIHPEENGYYTKKHFPLKIRFGGTTKELIADKKNWGLAIVSSKDVDVQALAEKNIINNFLRLSPLVNAVLSQWLLPQALKPLLPTDMNRTYELYFFDYDAQNDDATILILNARIMAISFVPEALMNMRSSAAKRSIDGISRVEYWTEEQLIAAPNDWDVATVQVKLPDGLKQLDQASLLLDLSQFGALADRETIPDAHNGYGVMPNGIFSEDGSMIGIPSRPAEPGHEDELEVMVVNAQTQHMARAIAFVLHYFKCADWVYGPENTWDPLSDELAAEFWK